MGHQKGIRGSNSCYGPKANMNWIIVHCLVFFNAHKGCELEKLFSLDECPPSGP